MALLRCAGRPRHHAGGRRREGASEDLDDASVACDCQSLAFEHTFLLSLRAVIVDVAADDDVVRADAVRVVASGADLASRVVGVPDFEIAHVRVGVLGHLSRHRRQGPCVISPHRPLILSG